jgi:hypothetical protein
MEKQEIANEIAEMSPEDMDDVMDLVYEQVNTESFNDVLTILGVDVSAWCRRKHPPAG